MRLRNLSVLAAPLAISAVATLVACGQPPPPAPVPPPTTALPEASAAPRASGPGHRVTTRKGDVADVVHGVRIQDPYRWLEDADAPEVAAWTEQQNAQTREIIDAIPGRERIKAEATELLQIGYTTPPAIRRTNKGLRYFHTKREGAQNQPTLYVRDGATSEDRPLVETSKLSEDGTTALDWWYPSWDGARVAWGRSESGSEESVLFVRDVATGKDLPDRIDRTRHASLAWLPDGKGFYYSRYPAPGTVPAGEEKYHLRIWFHVLGDDPSKDKLVFGEGRDKTDIPIVSISPDGRWLVMRVHMGWDKSELYVRDRRKGEGAAWVPVAVGKPALFEAIAENDRLYVQTNDGAPRYALYAVDYGKPERASWKPVLPEGPDVLHDVAVLKGDLVATYMKDASTRVERFGKDGRSKGAIALPGIGSAGITAMHDGTELFVSFASYVVPSRIFRVNMGAPTPELEPWDRVGAKFAVDDVEVRQAFATSKDGTRVPYFVVSKKGLVEDGQNPTVLYGYGGFNVNQTPSFSARALTAVKSGAVWVTAILRGGGELGEAWHQAGMLGRKQNVFDDYYAVAQALVEEKITSPAHLGAMGGSNGGLLVATAVTQRPELFRAGLSLVPLTDMVRYHHFRIAKLWIPEFGDPDKPEHFPFLYAYSPYHHVKDGVRYPSMLFTTAVSDSRVDPMHARKMAARMQEAQGDPSRPILLRVETKAGHGAGKPVTKLADELADELAFLLHELGARI